jgi:hypothetical protein
MSESRKTITMCGAALLVVIVAWATTPRARTPDVFSDRGQVFFPELTDPNAAASLEVVEFDETNGAPRALKVLNRNGRWTIPSQFDYPTDAKDRLGQSAAAIIALRKDDFVTDSTGDHRRLGVLDPLDVSLPDLKGRGTRVTIRGQNERLLAELIVGNTVEGRQGFRYVRVPGQKRVYLSRVGDLDLSADFADWIERDLLQVKREEIDDIAIRNYSVDERSGSVNMRESLRLQRKGEDAWTLVSNAGSEKVDIVAVNRVLTPLVGLRIVGVLPKPAGITAMLNRTAQGTRVSQEDVQDLARKGFYPAADGELLSNEGEIIVHTTSGIFYTLRFGEVAPGTPTSAPAADDKSKAPAAKDAPSPRENRYLFIMAAYDPSSASPPGRSTEEGEQRIALLRARFSPWYYIISADDFSKLRPTRADLVKARR